MSMLELMMPALVAALILVGIHGYLGIHIRASRSPSRATPSAWRRR
jgi:hypothetical protein